MSKEFYNWLNRISNSQGSDVSITPETQYLEKESQEYFSDCIKSLSIVDTYILYRYSEYIQRYGDDITYKKIAEILNLSSEDAVKQRMYRIRKNVQERMEEKYKWIKIKIN
jgi:DNA-directed RNA polymerase specialized sigma24 family protein